jgi:hypothetical protein
VKMILAIALALAAGVLGLASSATAQTNGIMRDAFEVPGYCPPGRVAHTTVSWRYDGIGRRAIDVTRAEALWGRWDAGQTPVDYPWLNVFAILWQFPRHGYLGAEFDIAPWVLSWQYNRMTHGETLPGPWTDISVSDWCGDFNPPDPWCMTDATYTGQSMGVYKLPEAPVFAGCTLQPLGTYYLNLRFTFPDVEHWDCGSSACTTTIQNNRNP